MSRTKAEIEVLEELGRLRRKERPLEITEIHLGEYYCPACGSENGSKGARTLGLPLVRRALIPAELCFHVFIIA